jgi:ParB family chromosome partitioning protein
MLELALVENIQRADLNAIEKAKAVRRMVDELQLTQEEAGRRLGLERSTIANMLRLLDLSADLQEMVSRGTLTAGHARALLAVEHGSVRTRLARKIAAGGMSVREAERLVAREGGATRTPRLRQPTPNVVELEERLSAVLGARVEIKAARKKGGKIVVHYTDNADFERVYEKITGQSTVDYPKRVPA